MRRTYIFPGGHFPLSERIRSELRYVKTGDAARIFGVHRDYFRKNSELRRHRVVLSRRLHMYPIDVLYQHFESRRAS